MVFVDTGAWFALSVPSDPDHVSAKEFVARNHERLVTSDYVVDELLTLFAVRRQKLRGIEWMRTVLAPGGCELVQIQSPDFEAACRLYEEFDDKAWSFTDCTSYVLMQRMAIRKAFAFDEHFRQFGTVEVVP